MAYDGRRSLYSSTAVIVEPKYEFVISDEKGKKEDITLMIELCAQKKVGDLIDAMSETDVELPSDVFQALDIALRDTMSKS